MCENDIEKLTPEQVLERSNDPAFRVEHPDWPEYTGRHYSFRMYAKNSAWDYLAVKH